MNGFLACHRRPGPAKYESGDSTTLLKLIYHSFDIKVPFACSMYRHASSLLYSPEETHPHVWLSPAYRRQTVHVLCFALKLVWKKISSVNTHTPPAGHGTVPPPVGFPQDPSQNVLSPCSTVLLNRLTPNDPYSGRTAPLTSKRCILYINSTNTSTEYFKHGIYSPFIFSSKCSLFHNSNIFGSCFIHVLYTGCAKIKKK